MCESETVQAYTIVQKFGVHMNFFFIKLIKSVSKDLYIVTKDYYFI